MDTYTIFVMHFAGNLSHDDGRTLFGAIDNTLQNVHGNQTIGLDFEDVDVVTPSFLNTALRDLISKYGRDKVKRHIKIRNATKQTIDLIKTY